MTQKSTPSARTLIAGRRERPQFSPTPVKSQLCDPGEAKFGHNRRFVIGVSLAATTRRGFDVVVRSGEIGASWQGLNNRGRPFRRVPHAKRSSTSIPRFSERAHFLTKARKVANAPKAHRPRILGYSSVARSASEGRTDSLACIRAIVCRSACSTFLGTEPRAKRLFFHANLSRCHSLMGSL